MQLIQRIRNRGLLWIAIHTNLWLFDRFFEYGLTPYVILKTGLVYGTLILMALSFLVCWLLTLVYDYVSINWVRDAMGLETIKEIHADFEEWRKGDSRLLRYARVLSRAVKTPFVWVFSKWPEPREHERENRDILAGSHHDDLIGSRIKVSRRFVSLEISKQQLVLFLFLSLFKDPMTTLIIFRPANSHTIGRREWGIFLASVFISNASWALTVWTGIEVVDLVFPGFREWVTRIMDLVLSLDWSWLI